MESLVQTKNDFFEQVKLNVITEISSQVYNNTVILSSPSKIKKVIEQYLLDKNLVTLQNKFIGARVVLDAILDDVNLVIDSEIRVIRVRKIFASALMELKGYVNEYTNTMKRFSSGNPIIISDITLLTFLLKDLIQLYL